MPPLQQHIEDSLEFKIQKTVFEVIKKWAHPLKIRPIQASVGIHEVNEDTRELTSSILDILREEVEKYELNFTGKEQIGAMTVKYRILDLLTIKDK